MSEEWIALAISLIIGGGICVLAGLLLRGRCAMLISGYNMMLESERARIDEAALCRFVGKILLPIGILMPVMTGGMLLGADWAGFAYAAVVVALVVFACVYSNTGGRFRKEE